MWKFFEWAWNLDWGEGFALLAILFVFWYGKKWIDNLFSGMNNRSKREMKALVREAMDEWADGVTYLTPNKGEGRYYCSKPDCEGVKFSGEN